MLTLPQHFLTCITHWYNRYQWVLQVPTFSYVLQLIAKMSLTHTLGFCLDYSILTALSDELSIQLRINRPQIHLFNQIHVLLMYA